MNDGLERFFLAAFFPQPHGIGELVHRDAVLQPKDARMLPPQLFERNGGVQHKTEVPGHCSDVRPCFAPNASDNIVPVGIEQFEGFHGPGSDLNFHGGHFRRDVVNSAGHGRHGGLERRNIGLLTESKHGDVGFLVLQDLVGYFHAPARHQGKNACGERIERTTMAQTIEAEQITRPSSQLVRCGARRLVHQNKARGEALFQRPIVWNRPEGFVCGG